LQPIKSRIAPTPSGFLHIGNAFSFVLTWLITRKNNGILQLRIDDIDTTRARNEYIGDIFSQLEWLGIDYDEGATSTTDFLKNYSQIHHLSRYNALINELWAKKMLYPCDCSRKQIALNSDNGQYARTCFEKSVTDFISFHNHNLRLITPSSFTEINDINGKIKVNLYDTMRDFVVRRKAEKQGDIGLPAYQIVSLSDDITNGINWIVRGEDLLHSTAAQIFLAQSLGLITFKDVIFYHHPIVRSQGLTSQAIYRIFSEWLALPPCETLTELLQHFEIQPVIQRLTIGANIQV
jgi:glutamyl-tRNA synthetase